MLNVVDQRKCGTIDLRADLSRQINQSPVASTSGPWAPASFDQ
jgi:hypothetical protein